MADRDGIGRRFWPRWLKAAFVAGMPIIFAGACRASSGLRLSDAEFFTLQIGALLGGGLIAIVPAWQIVKLTGRMPPTRRRRWRAISAIAILSSLAYVMCMFISSPTRSPDATFLRCSGSPSGP